VPKIDAPTVAEHHSRRRAALIDAGIAVIAERGVDALTLGAVAAATGLARSSVYQYFDSAPALIAAIVEGSFPAANDRLRAAVARAATPGEQVDAYVRTAIDLATDRTHRSLDALGTADLPAECRTRLAELHQEQYATLHAAVSGLGITDPELITRLLVGIVHAAAQAIVQGASRRRVTSRTLALIHQGLDSEVGGPRQ
jgi:AcrR family transcriptional regulator